MGSMSFIIQTTTTDWRYNDTNFCTMKNSSVNLASSIGNPNHPMPQEPTKNIAQTSVSDSCPKSYIENEKNEEEIFREFIASRLPEYKASPLLLAKIRSSIEKERTKSASQKLRSNQNK
jgi:hypothetical protein